MVTEFAQQSNLYVDEIKVDEWHIYGSSRLGVYEANRTISKRVARDLNNDNQITNSEYLIETPEEVMYLYSNYQLERGAKRYELANHLGNVLTAISDKKTANFTGTTFTNFTAERISATDYSPFGAPLAGRTWNGGEYRYGFNTQERDDEIAGVGNIMTAQFWEYDSRLGRGWNPDPSPDPSICVYACFRNNPILFVDIKGDTVKYGGLLDRVNTFFACVFNKGFKEKFKKWEATTDVYTILRNRGWQNRLTQATPDAHSSLSDPTHHAVFYNQGFGIGDISNHGLNITANIFAIPISISWMSVKLPVGVVGGAIGGIYSKISGRPLQWGMGDGLKWRTDKGDINLFGYGFGNYNSYNIFGAPNTGHPIHPDDAFFGLRFGIGPKIPINFIEIGHNLGNYKHGIHLHINIAARKRVNRVLKEHQIDVYR